MILEGLFFFFLNSVILNKTLQFPFKGDIWAQCGRQGRGSESRDDHREKYAQEKYHHYGEFTRQPSFLPSQHLFGRLRPGHRTCPPSWLRLCPGWLFASPGGLGGTGAPLARDLMRSWPLFCCREVSRGEILLLCVSQARMLQR